MTGRSLRRWNLRVQTLTVLNSEADVAILRCRYVACNCSGRFAIRFSIFGIFDTPAPHDERLCAPHGQQMLIRTLGLVIAYGVNSAQDAMVACTKPRPLNIPPIMMNYQIS